MSHELAHFALQYLGYSDAFKKDWVHQTQAKYDSCLKLMKDLKNCTKFWTTIRSPIGNYYPVMAIYDGIYDLLEKPEPKTYEQPKYVPPKQEEVAPTPAPIDRENFDWRWVSIVNFNVNGKTYIDLENGDTACYQVTTFVKGTLDDTLAYKKIRFTATVPGNPEATSEYRLLDKYGNYKNCETWTAGGTTILTMAVFDGDDVFRPSSSNIVRINLK